jgi:hypothetical protein
VDGVLVKHRTDQRLGIGRDRLGQLWFEAHGAPRPACNSADSILRRVSSRVRHR